MTSELQTLAGLVREMRQAQKDYFRTRSPEALRLSKTLESRVDRAVHEIAHQAVQGKQITLFGRTLS